MSQNRLHISRVASWCHSWKYRTFLLNVPRIVYSSDSEVRYLESRNISPEIWCGKLIKLRTDIVKGPVITLSRVYNFSKRRPQIPVGGRLWDSWNRFKSFVETHDRTIPIPLSSIWNHAAFPVTDLTCPFSKIYLLLTRVIYEPLPAALSSFVYPLTDELILGDICVTSFTQIHLSSRSLPIPSTTTPHSYSQWQLWNPRAQPNLRLRPQQSLRSCPRRYSTKHLTSGTPWTYFWKSPPGSTSCENS